MKNRLVVLQNLLERVSFAALWPHFTPTAYGLYNSQNFAIISTEKLDIDYETDGLLKTGKTTSHFMGNTAVRIGGVLIAIWNMDYTDPFMNDATLASKLIHEMFHAEQMRSQWMTFPNEADGLDYPTTEKSLALRTQERFHLVQALYAESPSQQENHLRSFNTLRQHRKQTWPQALAYEEGIENVEGTAVFVEHESYSLLVQWPHSMITATFLEPLTQINQRLLQHRASFYVQGLAQCLLCKQLIPNWQESLTQRKIPLSELLYNQFGVHSSLPEISVSPVIHQLVQHHHQQIDEIFQKFAQSKGEHHILRHVQITGFDPMNAVKRDSEIIHKYFLRVQTEQGEEIMIQHPCKATVSDSIFQAEQVEWFD